MSSNRVQIGLGKWEDDRQERVQVGRGVEVKTEGRLPQEEIRWLDHIPYDHIIVQLNKAALRTQDAQGSALSSRRIP